MFAQFPQEIVDTIIDFLHSDRESLSICSLVCHDWLESSRLHKFSSLLAITERSFNDFPLAIPYIRKITLSPYDPSFLFEIDFSKCTQLRTLELSGAEDLEIPNAPEIASVFPFNRLETLVLSSCSFQDSRHFLDLLSSAQVARRLARGIVG